jgi:hypothetical protein
VRTSEIVLSETTSKRSSSLSLELCWWLFWSQSWWSTSTSQTQLSRRNSTSAGRRPRLSPSRHVARQKPRSGCHLKINFRTLSYFSRQKSDRQLTTFTTHSTTCSPQKTIHKSPLFPKSPQKPQQTKQNPGSHQSQLFLQKSRTKTRKNIPTTSACSAASPPRPASAHSSPPPHLPAPSSATR